MSEHTNNPDATFPEITETLPDGSRRKIDLDPAPAAAREYLPVPVDEAKRISREFEKNQVVIWTYDNASSTQHVTTFGWPMLSDSIRAAEAGNAIKRLAGWPDELSRTLPIRLIQIFDELDSRLAADVENGALHKGTALAVCYQLREVLRQHDPELAEQLVATRTEAAEPKTALTQLEK